MLANGSKEVASQKAAVVTTIVYAIPLGLLEHFRTSEKVVY